MSSIHRNITRTIFNTTESTFQTQTPDSDTLAFAMGLADSFFIGFKEKFASRYFHFGTQNATARTVSVKYNNGTTFVAVADVVDQTRGFTRSGFLSWVNKNDWEKTNQAPLSEDENELFWIEITVDGVLDPGTTLQSLLNLFCDERLVQDYFPELITDTRYLPNGATDFTAQLNAAKNKVVHRLKGDHIILDESMILDINEVAIATVYAFRSVVLNAIAVSEGEKATAKEAEDDFNHELNRVKLDFDFDNSGRIEDTEKDIGNVVIVRG